MPQRRTRLFTALGLVTVAALLWGVITVVRGDGGTDRRAVVDATAAPDPGAASPVAGSAPRWSPPVPAAQVAVQPEVQAAIDAGRTTPVIVRLAVTVGGTDAERVAQVRDARDRFIAGLPPGSWTELKEVGTLPYIAVSLDGDGFDATRNSGLVTTIAEDEELLLPTAGNEPAADSTVASIDSTATMGAVPAWAAGWKGAGSTVAIVDTGVQTNHPYLMRGNTPKTIAEACFAAPCSSGSTMSVTDAPRVGSGNPCSSAISSCTHGTHVAGIAAGGNGSTIPSGVAPDADIIAINVFSEYLSGTTVKVGASNSSINTALDWLYYNRARFPGLTAVNMSLGGSTKYTAACDTFNTTKAYIDQLLTVGVSTVIAAGNSGWADGVASPGCISTAVTVGAVDGVPDQTTSYSNDGPQLDFMAPGTLITSSIVGSQMGTMSGTSMATPAVTGALAALRQATPDQTLARLKASGSIVNASSFLVPSVRLSAAASIYPGPAQSLSASSDTGRATVSWQPPASSGSSAVTGYSVTAVPGGARCTSTARTCTITGLTDGASYRFVVRAESSTGLGAQATTAPVTITPAPTTTTTSTTTTTTTTIAPTTSTTAVPNQVAPAPSSAYNPVAPVRLTDTRPAGAGAASVDGREVATGRLSGGSTRIVPVAGRGGVPASGAGAVALNVTVVDPTASGHLTVHPSGSTRPNASNLNFVPGQTVPNMVISKLGADGAVAVFNSQGSADVIVDVVGWFPSSGGYGAIEPQRFVETRGGGLTTIDGSVQGTGAIGSGQVLSVPVLGRGSIPVTGVSSVALNVTAVDPGAAGYLTVFPGGTSRPNASNLNFIAGQTVANMVVAKVGSDGTISVFNNLGATHVVIDVVGWFATTSSFNSLSPARLVESRPFATIDGREQNIGAIGGGGVLTFTVAGRGGVPASGARAVALNVTVVGPTASGYVAAFASGGQVPGVSNLNFRPGQVVPNMVIAELGPDGRVSLLNSAGSTPVVVDVVGWFS